MGKVLVALDGQSDSIRDIAAICKELFIDWREHLYVGLIVKDLSYQTRISGYLEKAGFEDYNPYENELLSEEEQKQAEAVFSFTKPAKKWGIKHEIYNDLHLTAYEFVKQTVYADLLVVNYRIFYNTDTRRADNSLLYYEGQ